MNIRCNVNFFMEFFLNGFYVLWDNINVNIWPFAQESCGFVFYYKTNFMRTVKKKNECLTVGGERENIST